MLIFKILNTIIPLLYVIASYTLDFYANIPDSKCILYMHAYINIKI